MYKYYYCHNYWVPFIGTQRSTLITNIFVLVQDVSLRIPASADRYKALYLGGVGDAGQRSFED
jgi:hypothetical protein